MWSSTAIAASTAAFLLSLPVHADGLYSKNSPVVQVTAKNYNRLIAKSNHTSIVEFYAPWCGHCKSLKPAYEKAAKNLQGLAKVASVNCDDDQNKGFCGEMGVKGYPTLKIVRPSKKAGARPSIEEYQGARSAKAIVDAVVERIPNHVTRVTDKSIGSWLKKSNETAKVILFTDKGTTSALLRALAIDFLGNIHVGQVHKKEAGAIETFGIKKYPTIVLLSGGDKEAVVYSGDIKKEPLSEFLSQIAEPNPDPAPEATKGQKAKSQKISQKKKKDETEKKPTKEAPVSALPAITDDATLREKCLSSSSKICALVLLPKIDAAQGEASAALIPRLRAIQDVHDKYARRKASFPIYLVQPDLALAATLRKELELQDDGHLEMVAINARRLWWRKYNSAEYSADSVEAWIDTIRMNEGKKEKLPESLLTTESTQEGAKDEGKKIGAKDKEEPVAKKIEHEEL